MLAAPFCAPCTALTISVAALGTFSRTPLGTVKVRNTALCPGSVSQFFVVVGLVSFVAS